MRRTLNVAALLALALFAGAGLSLRAADDEKPSISEIMKKVNGKMGIHKAVGTELSGAKVDWDKVQKLTADYAKYGAALGKNEPPMGDMKSWEKLSKKWADDAKKLDDAAKKKDAAAAKSAHGTLQKSCGACHKAHKP